MARRFQCPRRLHQPHHGVQMIVINFSVSLRNVEAWVLDLSGHNAT